MVWSSIVLLTVLLKAIKEASHLKKKIKDKLQNNREQVEEIINKYRANVL